MKASSFLTLGIIILLTSCNQLFNKNEGIRDGIFIHITQSFNDPHRALMPLKMANMMAMDKDVLVYFDIHAVELLTKMSKDMQFADFDPLKKLLQGLIDKKVGLYACPTCMKIANI